MFNKTRMNIKEAENLFKSMGCSSFHMARENAQRYKEYQAMKISKIRENSWRYEEVLRLKTELQISEDSKKLWSGHCKMADIVENLRTSESLKEILEVTEQIFEKINCRQKVIISETLNGRKHIDQRSGIIFLAADLNEIVMAKEFVELSKRYSGYELDSEYDVERCKSARLLCEDIERVIDI